MDWYKLEKKQKKRQGMKHNGEEQQNSKSRRTKKKWGKTSEKKVQLRGQISHDEAQRKIGRGSSWRWLRVSERGKK